MGYARMFQERVEDTPQTEPIVGREAEMTQNHAGGYTFKLDKWGYLERFLVLGTEGGTYYVSPKRLTVDAAKNVIKCIAEDGERVVDMTVAVSVAGIAPKQDPAIFVMALCMAPRYADVATRRHAANRLPEVARTASHLFSFVREVDQLRGWGRQLRSAIANWYEQKSFNGLAYQMVKYQSRAGWSHRDLLRKSHATTSDRARNNLYRYAVSGPSSVDGPLPGLIRAVEAIKTATPEEARRLIAQWRLTHEMVPNDLKKEREIWIALLEDMPMTAMIRNLGNMSNKGVFSTGTEQVIKVISTLKDRERLQRARVHPVSLLSAWNTYKDGHGFKGQLSWTPVNGITDALESAFYASFDYVEPSNKRILLGLDVSGSMRGYNLQDYGLNMSVRDATAVMALLTAKVEPLVEAIAFTSSSVRGTRQYGSRWGGVAPFPLSAHDSLSGVIKRMDRLPFGGTDCALPMLWATEQRQEFDAIVIYTDNETWAGSVHPMQALKQYRDQTGISAKLIVVGMVATEFTIADPLDPYCLDIAGFDARTPGLISRFSAA